MVLNPRYENRRPRSISGNRPVRSNLFNCTIHGRIDGRLCFRRTPGCRAADFNLLANRRVEWRIVTDNWRESVCRSVGYRHSNFARLTKRHSQHGTMLFEHRHDPRASKLVRH